MADPLGSLEKIVKLALRIKEAVDTVRQNKEECQQIRTRAVRVSSLLSRLPETGMTADPAMCDALEDLEDSLRRAHTIVAACQDSTTLCVYCTAGRQARRLRRVQDDIGQKVQIVVFAINIQTTIILTNNRIGEAGPPVAGETIETHVADTSNSNLSADDSSSSRPTSFVHPRRSGGRKRNKVRKSVFDLIPSLSLCAAGCFSSERTSTSLPPSTQGLALRVVNHSLSALDSCLRKFSVYELEVATNHFSMENMIGSGGSATVYKGILHDGLVVAIKKFRNPYACSAERINELHLVSKLKHKNIVKLIGYGSEVLEKAEQLEDAKDKETSYFFVEEYMPNGSLNKIINGLQLDWSGRFLLIQGIAEGLCYLHKENVVHLDVKPSNILLDSDMSPKITDFGIARVLNHKGVDIYSDIGTIAGTLGYMPPEYITDGTLSKKHDVYGFGVTLLEVISAMSRYERATAQAAIEWAWNARQAGGTMLVEVLEPSLFDEPQLKEIEKSVEVGLLCTQSDLADRPDMAEALEMLRGEKALRTPVRPGYTKEPTGWFGGWPCLRVRL
ncbi:unnamed protein product [Urochloa humidicola]